MSISDAVHIWREEDGDFHVEWETSRPGARFTVEPLNAAGEVQIHYTEHPSPRLRLAGLPDGGRQLFRVRDEQGNEVLAGERRLAMDGTPNFRDFGGYRTADGRQVKWGYLYRSGQLSNLSDRDVRLLASLELDLVCDFRRLDEQQGDPSRLPPERTPRVASLPITPGSNARFFEEAEQPLDGRQAMFDFMLEINRDFAEDQTDTFARMFREILGQENARFLVHCAAGKDRTGFAAAMILLALGVPVEVVMRDYMLTGRFFRPERELERLRRKYEMDHLGEECILPMLEVREDYLRKALAVIERDYPSVERYLEEKLGVGPAELEELRARYLQ